MSATLASLTTSIVGIARQALLADQLGRLEAADAREGLAASLEGGIERFYGWPPQLAASRVLEEAAAIAAAGSRFTVDAIPCASNRSDSPNSGSVLIESR